MACIIPADLTNGVESKLYNKLLEIYDGNESKARQSYSYFRTEKFLDIFGNYADAIENNYVPDEMLGRLDEETFEPQLFYHEDLNKYYFIDKEGEKVFYPSDRQGLNGIFDTNEIKEFAKSLAFTYYDRYLTFNLDTLEFENNSGVGLTEFIEEFVEEVGEHLAYDEDSSVDQTFLGESLLESLSEINEWRNEVIGIYNSFKLDVVEESISDDVHIEERAENSDDLIRIESHLKDSKLNVSGNIKLYLSLIKRDKKNMFGLNKFVEFGDIYTSLNKSLADITSTLDENGNPEDMFEIYKEEIAKLAQTKPYFQGLYQALDQDLGGREEFRNQIVSAFRLSYNNYLGSEVHKEEDGSPTYTTKNLSEVSSRRANLIKQWQFNFNNNFYDKENKKWNVPLGRIRSSYNNFRTVSRHITSIDQLLKPLPGESKSIIDRLIEDLEHLGITLNTEGKLSSRDTLNDSDIQRGLMFFLDDLKLGGSSLEAKKEKILEFYTNSTRALERFVGGVHSNIFADQSVFTQLAEAEAFFQEEGSDASIYTVGKTKWVYSLPSYLSEKLNGWKKHPRLLFKHYNQTPYNQGSHFMRYLLGIDNLSDPSSISEIEWRKNYEGISRRRLEVVSLNIFNSAQNKGDATNAKDSKEIGELDSIVDFMNKTLAFKKGEKVYHRSALAADKSTAYELHYGNPLSIKSGVTHYDAYEGVYNFSTEVMDILYDYFKSEYRRMAVEFDNIEHKPDSEKISGYHTGKKNALKSQLFPSFSVRLVVDPVTKEEHVELPEDKDLHVLYDPVTGKAHLENLDAFKDVIVKKIRKILSENVDDIHSQLLEDGLFVLNDKGQYVNLALDKDVYNTYKKEAMYDSMVVKTIASDLLVNSIISQVEYSKLFTGDTAYYKDMIDYKKRVPASYTDGLYLNINSSDDVNFNAAVIDSVKIPAYYIDELTNLLGENSDIVEYYRNINAADAQAWITPERWKFLRKKMGKWSSKDDAIFTKMHDPDATFEPSELIRLAQPLKGVYFDIVDGAPRYLKYSQAVLLPNLIRNTPLENLYNKMVLDENGNKKEYKDQIHEVITKDGIKVGAQGVTTAHDPETGELLENFELNSFKLTNSGWKLQQDLTPKGFKSTELGSQIIKVIFQGLSHNKDKTFIVGEQEMTGAELIDHIHSLTNTLSDRGIQQVMKRLGVNENTFEIENEDRMYAAMIEDLSKRRDTDANTINALRAGTSPYGIPGQFQIFQNVFSSAINKATVKIRTNGGSFIQMADFGISKSEAESGRHGIRFAPWFKDGQNKLHTPEKYVDEQGRTRVRPGGVFISGALVAKYVPNYKELTDKELFGEYNSKTGKYEKGLIDEKILKNIVGYRIPNQGLPSNDAFHVMGLLPEDAADTIIAYTGITTKTGSDFDIDKMYVMVPSFYPVTNLKDEAYKFIEDSFRGETIRETLDNLSGYLIETTGSELSKEQIAEELHADLSTNKGRQKAIGHLKTALVDLMLDPRNADKDIAVEFKEKFKPEIKRLKYAEPIKENGAELPLHEQPLEVIQNKLIEAYVGVLTNINVAPDLMKPIDEPFVEDDIKNMRPEVPRKDMMDFDAFSDISLKQEFKLGKAGLGQNVNSLVDSVLGSMGRMTLINTYVGRGNSDLGVTKFDEQYSEKLTTDDLRAYVRSYNKFNPAKPIKLEDVQHLAEIRLDDTMKALVNGFVDIAKDPYITRGGWVTQTNNVGFLLVRAGVHPFYVNAFLGQPILKEYVRFVNNNESNIIDNTDDLKEQFLIKKAKDVFLEKQGSSQFRLNGVDVNPDTLYSKVVPVKTLKTLLGAMKSEEGKTAAIESVTQEIRVNLRKSLNIGALEQLPSEVESKFDDLLDNIIEGLYATIIDVAHFDPLNVGLDVLRDQIMEENLNFQLSVLNKFFELIPLAKNLNRSVKGSKSTTEGKGKNITSLIVANNYARDILLEQINGKEGALDGFATKLKNDKGEDTYLNRTFKNAILTPYKIMRANPKFFMTAQDEFVSSFNYISYMLYGNRLQNQNLADELEKANQSYIMSGFAPLQLTNEQKLKLLEELPVKLSELKKDPLFEDNLLVQMLYVKEGTDRSYIAMPNSKKSVSTKNSLVDSWRHLLERKPEFGEDLVKYSYIISGFNMSINQFHEFIPYEWFNKHRFNSYLKDVARRLETGTVDLSFIDQFHRHNFESSKLTKSYSQNVMEKVDNIPVTDAFSMAISEDVRPNHFIYIQPMPNDFTNPGKPLPDKMYYILAGWTDNRAYYVRTTPLGGLDAEGNKIVEYDFSTRTDSNRRYAESIMHKLPDSVNKNNIRRVLNDYYGGALAPEVTVEEMDTQDITKLLDNNNSEEATTSTVVTNKDVSSINIYAGTNENAHLSNFAERPFKLGDDVTYPTVEHAFQLSKLQYAKGYTEADINEIYDKYLNVSAAEIKKFGKTVKQLDTRRWDEDAYGIMKDLVKASFAENPNALKSLLATGDAQLTHNQDKSRWGKDFPNILMEVREELRGIDNREGIREYTPENITSLRENEIFVFGSNEGSSRGGKPTHGKGAARVARDKFGAIQGQPRGLQGQSYAIVTKKHWDVPRSSTLDEIYDELVTFVDFANSKPNLKFYMTKIASSLGGYSVEEIADLFNKLHSNKGIPNNVVLPKEYEMRDAEVASTSSNNIYNPTSISEASRQEYKEFVESQLGKPTRIIKIDDNSFHLEFEGDIKTTLHLKQGQFSNLAQFQKNKGDDLRMFAGLSKIVEEHFSQDPTMQSFEDYRDERDKNDPFLDCPF